MEGGIMAVAELRPAIRVMQIDEDVGGIEQHDQVLREIRKSIDAQFSVAEQDRARLGDTEIDAHDCEIHIRHILRGAHGGNVAIAGNLRHGRAHDLRIRDLCSYRRQPVAGRRQIEKDSAHALKAVLESSEKGSLGDAC